MWKAKRKSKRRKNDKKIYECEEFRQKRERYITKLERMKREFEEFIEERERREKKRQELLQELIEDLDFLNEMRDATKEEREKINGHIDSIFKPTGVSFWDLIAEIGESESAKCK